MVMVVMMIMIVMVLMIVVVIMVVFMIMDMFVAVFIRMNVFVGVFVYVFRLFLFPIDHHMHMRAGDAAFLHLFGMEFHTFQSASVHDTQEFFLID